MNDLPNRLRDWDLAVRQLVEQAEARLAEGNALVGDLYRTGRVRGRPLLGPILSVQPYDPGCGPEDSGQATQAVLHIPQGFGVVFWDTEDMLQFQGKERQEEAKRLFTPIADCPPLLRILFLPFASELLQRLLKQAR